MLLPTITCLEATDIIWQAEMKNIYRFVSNFPPNTIGIFLGEAFFAAPLVCA